MSGFERAYSFRTWLFERLLSTKWATVAMTEDAIDALSERLGVSPGLLCEVRAQAKIDLCKSGLRMPSANDPLAPGFKRFYQFHLFMPPPVFKAWKEECEFRQLPEPVLLRSLIQEYLLDTREPTPLRFWYWEGKRHQMPKKTRDSCLVRATITHGANRALKRRARRIGSRPTALARALIIEALEGGHRDVRLIEHGSMYDDESRYLAAHASRLTEGDPSR